MEEDLIKVLFKKPQVANSVNCFTKKIKLIEGKYPEEFSVDENINLTFNDYGIRKEIIGNVSAIIKAEINHSFSECLLKFGVKEIFLSN